MRIRSGRNRRTRCGQSSSQFSAPKPIPNEPEVTRAYSTESARRLLMTLNSIALRFPEKGTDTKINEGGATASHMLLEQAPVVSPVFESSEHSRTMLSHLNELRRKDAFCDVVVQSGSKRVSAHRVVLASGSEYFRDLFGRVTDAARFSTVVVHSVNEHVFEQLIEFMYTGKIPINTTNVQHLIAGASLLQLDAVVDACCVFLKQRLHPINCVNIMRVAELLKQTELLAACKRFVERNFEKILQHDEELLVLDEGSFVELISNPRLEASEDRRFEALRRWVNYDENGRQQVAANVCKFIRISRLSREYLSEMSSAKHQWINSSWLSEFLMEALAFQMHPERESSAAISEFCDVIMVAGGVFAGRSIDIFNLQTQKWVNQNPNSTSAEVQKYTLPEVPEIPSPRSHCGAVFAEDLLYLIGGQLNEKYVTPTVDIYDTTENMWTPGPHLQCPRYMLGVAVLSQKIYAIGGSCGHSTLSTAEVLDRSTNQWSYITPMLRNRVYPGVAALKDKLCVIGSWNEEACQFISTVECYNPNTNSWTSIKPLPSVRGFSGVCVLNNRIYVVGGRNDKSTAENSGFVYHPDTGTWHSIACTTFKRTRLSLVAHGGFLYAVGGKNELGERLHTIEQYDPNRNIWTVLRGQMATVRWMPGVAVVRLKHVG